MIELSSNQGLLMFSEVINGFALSETGNSAILDIYCIWQQLRTNRKQTEIIRNDQ